MVEAHMSGLSQEELKRLAGMAARHRLNPLTDTTCAEFAWMARGDGLHEVRAEYYSGFSNKFFQIVCKMCDWKWDY